MNECSMCGRRRPLGKTLLCSLCAIKFNREGYCDKCRRGFCEDFPNKTPVPCRILYEGTEPSIYYCAKCFDYGTIGFVDPDTWLGKKLKGTFLNSWVVQVCSSCGGIPIFKCPQHKQEAKVAEGKM